MFSLECLTEEAKALQCSSCNPYPGQDCGPDVGCDPYDDDDPCDPYDDCKPVND